MKILDVHPHVITTDEKRYPRDPLGGTPSGWSKERPTTTEMMVAAMNEAGVAKSAIVQASTCYGFDNSYVADAVVAHPDRFTGVFSVDMLAADAPQKIRHWVDRKLTGLRLFTTGSTMHGQADWLDDPRTFPGWAMAGELGIPVCVRIDITSGPPYAGAQPLTSLVKYPNIYLKLTSNSVRDSKLGQATPQSFFRHIVDAFGASRIAWGSNFPASPGSLKQILADSRDALAFLPAADQEWIFCRTAETLYPALATK